MEELTIWGIHAGKTGNARTLFMEHDVVALGWMEFGDLGGYAARDEYKWSCPALVDSRVLPHHAAVA